MLITGSISQVGSKNKQNEGCLHDVSGVKKINEEEQQNNNKKIETNQRRNGGFVFV
jgi:hypothetical protein